MPAEAEGNMFTRIFPADVQHFAIFESGLVTIAGWQKTKQSAACGNLDAGKLHIALRQSPPGHHRGSGPASGPDPLPSEVRAGASPAPPGLSAIQIAPTAHLNKNAGRSRRQYVYVHLSGGCRDLN